MSLCMATEWVYFGETAIDITLGLVDRSPIKLILG